MSATTDNEITVPAVLSVYVILALAYGWLMTRRADELITAIRERDPEGLWKDLGSPRNLREATRDPQRRWSKLLRHGGYRSLCSPDLSARIEDFLRHLNAGGAGGDPAGRRHPLPALGHHPTAAVLATPTAEAATSSGPRLDIARARR